MVSRTGDRGHPWVAEEGRGSTEQSAGESQDGVTCRFRATERRPPMAGPDPPGRGPAQVRVKRCGKSAPASGATPAARQPPLGARPSVPRVARPIGQVGRTDGWSPTGRQPWDRTPPTSRLTIAHQEQCSEKGRRPGLLRSHRFTADHARSRHFAAISRPAAAQPRPTDPLDSRVETSTMDVLSAIGALPSADVRPPLSLPQQGAIEWRTSRSGTVVGRRHGGHGSACPTVGSGRGRSIARSTPSGGWWRPRRS